MSSRPDTTTLLGGVAASVAHELNNQLAILMGRAELLAEDLAAESALAEDVRVIREAAAHTHRAAGALVGLVRTRPLQAGRVGFNEQAQSAAAVLAYTLRSAGLALELQPDPEAPWTVADEGAVLRPLLALLHLVQREARALAPAGLRLVVKAGPGSAEVSVTGPPLRFAEADLAALRTLAANATLEVREDGLALRFARG